MSKRDVNKRDDLALYEDLFLKNYQLLTAKAFEVCASWEVAEDVVQDFFTDVWFKKSWQRVQSDFTAYAVKGVQYKAITVMRREVRLDRYRKEELGRPLPEEMTDREKAGLEEERKLVNALNDLPAQRKEAFLLAHYYDKSYAEIAAEMNVSVNTVKTHLRLAMQQLRDFLLWVLLFFKIF